MAKSILDIVIKTIKQGDGDKGVVKGLVHVKTALAQTGVYMAALAGAAYAAGKALDATVGQAVEYANKVEGIANMTGLSADESSRLIQVTDDLRISYDDLSASVKKNSDVTDFSIEGLAALSSEYSALGSQQEKQAFAQKHFGKQWGEFIKVLEAGPEQLKQMSAAVSDSLVMTEEGIEAAKKYQENIDQLSDSWQALTISLGNKTIPVLNSLLENINLNIAANDNLDAALEKTGGNYRAANSLAYKMAQEEQAAADATRDHTDAMTDAGDAAAELEVNYGSLLDVTMNLQDGFDKFSEKESEIRQKIDETNASFAEGNMTAEEHGAKLDELNGDLAANASAMEEWSKRTVFALVQARLAAEGGIDANEFAFLIGLGEQMGILDSKTAEMAAALNEEINKIDTSGGQAAVNDFAGSWEDLLGMPHSQTFTVTTITSTTSTPTLSPPSPSCFLAGTQITLGNGNLREIQDVRSGDMVLTMEPETGATMQGRVAHVLLRESDHYYQITLSSGVTLKVTGEHPMWVNIYPHNDGAWLPVKELCVGWSLRGTEGGVSIETIRRIEGRVPVYNLHVAHEWHTYLAEGALVHNKATGGIVRAPGDGLQDTVMVPLAAGEGVLNVRAMSQPGMADLLHTLNAGMMPSGRGGGRAVTIYGGLTIVAQGSVMDVLDQMSD